MATNYQVIDYASNNEGMKSTRSISINPVDSAMGGDEQIKHTT